MTEIDIPAFLVDSGADGIIGSDALSTTDTSSELVLDQSSQPLGIGHYGATGDGNITLPEGLDPDLVVSATYVVIAYAESSETLVDPADWSPDVPDPTQAPFLMIESSISPVDNRTLDPIPVGAYAGETVWVGDDLANVLAGTPANRIWLQSYSDIPIHVAYAAVRLIYAEADGELKPVRRRFY